MVYSTSNKLNEIEVLMSNFILHVAYLVFMMFLIIQDYFKRDVRCDDGSCLICLCVSYHSKFLPIFIHFWMGSAANSFEEWFVWNKSICIFFISAFLQQGIYILSFKLLTKVEQNVLKFTKHHGTIFLFIVKFATFHKVFKRAHVLECCLHI